MSTANRVDVVRRTRRGPAVAVALSCVFLALLLAGFVIKATRTGFIADDAAFTVSLLATQAVGLLLTIRRPENRFGWIVCGLAWALALQQFVAAYTALAIQLDWPLTVAVWIDAKSFLLVWTGVIALFLYFPTGRLPSPRWRVGARFAFGAVIFGLLSLAVAPGPILEDAPLSPGNPLNPTAVPVEVWNRFPYLNGVALGLLLLALIVALASLVVRYRGAAGTERLQIRWVVAAAIAFGSVSVGAVIIRQLRTEWLTAADVAAGLAFILLPVSMAIAVLRFHLYEIDRVISRSVVYTALTVVLGVAYLGVVTAMRTVTAPLTGDTALAVVASTLVVAALFRPLRRRFQEAVDRRFNRARYDAAATVEALRLRFRDEVDLNALKRDLVAVVHATMQPAGTTLWLREVEP